MFRFSPENIKRVANAEIAEARKYRDENIAHFRNDPGMVSMFRADCRTRIRAAQLAKQGDYKLAASTMKDQDTAAREAVTDEFWNLMNDLVQEVEA